MILLDGSHLCTLDCISLAIADDAPRSGWRPGAPSAVARVARRGRRARPPAMPRSTAINTGFGKFAETRDRAEAISRRCR